jgi:hypothetical protein
MEECFGVWDLVKKETAKALLTYRKKEWIIVKDGTIAGKEKGKEKRRDV